MSTRGIARLGDKTYGVCYAHKTPITVGGRIVTASDDTFCESRGVARLGDKVMADCGHTSRIVTASQDGFVDGRGTARLGDKVEGPYVARIVTASPKAFVK